MFVFLCSQCVGPSLLAILVPGTWTVAGETNLCCVKALHVQKKKLKRGETTFVYFRNSPEYLQIFLGIPDTRYRTDTGAICHDSLCWRSYINRGSIEHVRLCRCNRAIITSFSIHCAGRLHCETLSSVL